MPSTTAAPAQAKRFELPQLTFNFSSLTEGTNIPPPPESPTKEVPTPPKTPPIEEKKVAEEKSKANGSPNTTATAGTKRPADDAPLSPAPSSRAGSIRRLFSRNLLNNAYAEGESQTSTTNGATAASNRPMSRSNGSILDEKKAKRGSGFFRRLRTGDAPSPARKATVPFDNPANNRSKPEVRGPPPPMIPELSALESKVDVNDGGSLGSDLFKDIK